MPDLSGKVALVTGGTRGLGRAIGLRLGEAGATVWLTHRWGSADEAELKQAFALAGAPDPVIVTSDAGRADDRNALIDVIWAAHGGLDVLVSNVCVVGRGGSLDRWTLRTLRRSLSASALPLEHLVEACAARGRVPTRVVATSSDGVDCVYPDYDYVAHSKAVLEASCRDLASRYRDAGMRVNALRTRLVPTAGLTEVFGPELVAMLDAFPEYHVLPEEVADAALALCGDGLALSGRVLRVDRGASLVDNVPSSGPLLRARLSGASTGTATAPAADPLQAVALVGDGPWSDAVRGELALAGVVERPDADAVLFSMPSGTAADRADRVWPVVASIRDGARRAVLVHEGGADGALARSVVQHISARAPGSRVNALRAAGPGDTARAAITALGPLLRAVRGQDLDLGRVG